jgi:hypothetical protein
MLSLPAAGRGDPFDSRGKTSQRPSAAKRVDWKVSGSLLDCSQIDKGGKGFDSSVNNPQKKHGL